MQSWNFAAPEVYKELRKGDAGRYTSWLQWLPVAPASTIFMPCLDVPAGTSGHWTLLVICFPKVEVGRRKPAAEVFMFDSTGGAVSANHLTALKTLRKQLQKHRDVVAARLWKKDTVACISPGIIQRGVHDCGIWIMAVARAILNGDPHYIPQAMQMPGLRVVLAAEALIHMRLPVIHYSGVPLWRTELAAREAGIVILAKPEEVCFSCFLHCHEQFLRFLFELLH